MSVTVMAPTPALPRTRRVSVWVRIFGSFKLSKSQDVEMPALPSSNGPRVAKQRLASVSTGVDTAKISYNRKASIAMAKEVRSASPQASSPSKSRAASIASTKSRRMSRSSRRASWWRSANPETDESIPAVPDLPAVPALPVAERKYSIFGSHNPDMEEIEDVPTPSPTATRRPSYVPRNAASSFLKTTTPLSSEEKVDAIRRASVADLKSPARSHRASVADFKPVMKNRASVADFTSVNKRSSVADFSPSPLNKRASMADFSSSPARSYRSGSVADFSPVKTHRPAPLNFNNDSTASHGMFSMAGVCEIQESAESDLISPRGAVFPVSPAPLSPTDTIMETDVEVIDSAKPSPELLPIKAPAHVAVVELLA